MPATKRQHLFDGEPGESVFWKPFVSVFFENEMSNLLEEVEELQDERLLAIVAALIVENRVDALNEAFIPKYKLLLENTNDFKFSTKITLLQSLDLIPGLLLRAAHCIRGIRNEFAHHLDKSTLSAVDEKYLNKLKATADEVYGIVKNRERPSKLPLVELFRKVLWYCSTGLDVYKYNIKLLREEFSKPAIVEGLERLAAQRHMDRLQQVLAQKPISVVEEYGLIIETFEGGVKNIITPPTPTPPSAEGGPA